ncbi:MAG TPA: ribonuclease P protein component [Usitatibacter sp.]|nr:ribonuclease P protein component [Usitatibacter sp.]
MPRNARKEGFSRRHRFAENGSFGPVLRGSRKARGELAVIHCIPGRSGVSRFGVGLTRRLVPSSVERNRVKRIAREAFRRHPLKPAGFDCVVTLRQKIAPGAMERLAGEIAALLDKIHHGR